METVETHVEETGRLPYSKDEPSQQEASISPENKSGDESVCVGA